MEMKILGLNQAYYADDERKGPNAAMYDAMSRMYSNENNKVTFTELKMNYDEFAIVPLQKLKFITEQIDYQIINDASPYRGQRQRIKSYQLTPQGLDFFREFNEYNAKMGDRSIEDILTDFKLSLNTDKALGTASLRSKLNQIEKDRKGKTAE